MTEAIESLKGKKLLVLGGADLHTELVNTAKQLGVETYVTDYLPLDKAPAKRAADHAWDLNVRDTDAILERCREEKIDGVINMYYDPCQLPYQKITEQLGLPCFGTQEQYSVFTDKLLFTKTCAEYGLDIIHEYKEEDFLFDNPAIEYPVFVKPCDSRASRGQTICRTYSEVAGAIELARKNSNSGKVVIQRFIEGGVDLMLTFLVVDGEIYWLNTETGFNTAGADGLTSTITAAYLNSAYEDRIPAGTIEKIRAMFKALKLENTPVFMQGFLVDGRIYFYDPAMRFAASYMAKYIKYYHDFDLFTGIVQFALTGRMPAYFHEAEKIHDLNGHVFIMNWVLLRPGTIKEVRGMDWVDAHMLPKLRSINHKVGDTILDTRDYQQCFSILTGDFMGNDAAVEGIKELYRNLIILDENGDDMKVVFDAERMRVR